MKYAPAGACEEMSCDVRRDRIRMLQNLGTLPRLIHLEPRHLFKDPCPSLVSQFP